MHRYQLLLSGLVISLCMAAALLVMPGIAGAEARLSKELPGSDGTVGLGDRLKLKVINLGEIVANRDNLVVSIDGIEVAGIAPLILEDDVIAYDLTLNDRSREPLLKLLRRLPVKGKLVTVRLINGDKPLQGSTAVVLKSATGIGWALLLIYLVVAAVFVTTAVRSNLLREPGKVPGGKKKAFSLSRVQLAWWLFVVLASYLLLYWIRREPNVFGGSAFVLLGISVGTTAGAAYVDHQKEEARKKKETPDTSAPADKKIPLSRTFFQDILSNDDGAGMHRFQFFAWSAALGAIFLIESWSNLVMPTFGEELLALVGVSATAYVGLKMPEKPKPPNDE